jgi:hypothetical protein
LSRGNFIEAIEIFESIFNNHREAPARLAECKLKQGIKENTKNETEAIRENLTSQLELVDKRSEEVEKMHRQGKGQQGDQDCVFPVNKLLDFRTLDKPEHEPFYGTGESLYYFQ